jgi:hypothetical protein
MELIRDALRQASSRGEAIVFPVDIKPVVTAGFLGGYA